MKSDKCHFLQPYVWCGRWRAGRVEGLHLACSKRRLVLKCILSISGFLCVCDGEVYKVYVSYKRWYKHRNIMASFHVFELSLGHAEMVIIQRHRFSVFTVHGLDFLSGQAGKRKWRYKTSNICEKESQSLLVYSHPSARAVYGSLPRAQVNAPGQRRTVREQMLLAVCVSHSNLANFPAEICAWVSHVFASLTHFCIFKYPHRRGNSRGKWVGAEHRQRRLVAQPLAELYKREEVVRGHLTTRMVELALVVGTCARRDTSPL